MLYEAPEVPGQEKEPIQRVTQSRFINNKFTLNLTILALLLITRQFTLVVKFNKNYGDTSQNSFNLKCKCGALERVSDW
jgi:hypothetical protein